MSTKQTEAQRLADWLDHWHRAGSNDAKAAAELRKLESNCNILLNAMKRIQNTNRINVIDIIYDEAIAKVKGGTA